MFPRMFEKQKQKRQQGQHRARTPIAIGQQFNCKLTHAVGLSLARCVRRPTIPLSTLYTSRDNGLVFENRLHYSPCVSFDICLLLHPQPYLRQKVGLTIHSYPLGPEPFDMDSDLHPSAASTRKMVV